MSPGAFTLPPTTITASLLNGALVALVPGVPYQRRINSIYVECSMNSAVEIYRGLISDASKIGGHPIGNRNTYMPPNRDIVPAGFPLFVRWSDDDSGSAFATVVFEGIS